MSTLRRGGSRLLTKAEVRKRIAEVGIIPAVRVASAEDALFASNALFCSGIPIVELTMTIPDVMNVLSKLAASDSQAIVGAGTVLTVEEARLCAEAGASFLTSPGTDREIVEFAKARNIVVIPGALTATEVLVAWKAGADFVKIFPCAQVGGAGYIRALKAPFPDVPMIASGGVTQQTASDFIRSGAAVLGIGEDLIPREAVTSRNASWIGELSRRFLGSVKAARALESRRTSTAFARADNRK